MTAFLWFLAGAVLVLVLLVLWKRQATFRAQRVTDYSATGPEFDIRQTLSGPILCEGVIYGPTGRVAARFVADMHGEWTGNTGVLTESFRYDDGSEMERRWDLQLTPDGKITALADDIVGEGTGQQSGAAVQLRYKFQMPQSSGGHVLDVVDWMYLTETGAIINRSQFRKFGIEVAELVATMRPNPAAEKLAAE